MQTICDEFRSLWLWRVDAELRHRGNCREHAKKIPAAHARKPCAGLPRHRRRFLIRRRIADQQFIPIFPHLAKKHEMGIARTSCG